MIARRPIIEPKKPVYLGCEGDSEVAYGQAINDLLRSRKLPVYLDVESLAPAAGDPLTRVQQAVKRIKERERKRARFRLKAILMDSDQAVIDPRRAAQARLLATRENIELICMDATTDLPKGQFDAVAVSGSLPVFDTRLIDAVKPDGRLFVIVGESPVMDARIVTRTGENEWTTKSLFETDVRPLLNASRPPAFSF